MENNVLDVLGRNWKKGEKQLITGRIIQSYSSSVPSFHNNDKIEIEIPNKNLYTLPSESVLVVSGKALKKDGTARAPGRFVTNAYAFLFQEIRYELQGVLVDSARYPGIAGFMKNQPLLSKDQRRKYNQAAFGEDDDSTNDWLIDDSGMFEGWVPLNLLLGFCEDHTSIVTGVTQKLVLIRSRNDDDALVPIPPKTDYDWKIEISSIRWRIPQLTLSNEGTLRVVKAINSGNPFPIRFTQWVLHEYPNVPQTNKFEWTVTTVNGLQQPDFIIFGLQNGKNKTIFDLSKLRSVRLFVNEKFYPYTDLQIESGALKNHQMPEVYEMISRFECKFYGREPISAITAKNAHNACPLVCFDLTEREDATIATTSNIKIVIETKDGINIQPGTTAYCLILRETKFAYYPIKDYVTSV